MPENFHKLNIGLVVVIYIIMSIASILLGDLLGDRSVFLIHEGNLSPSGDVFLGAGVGLFVVFLSKQSLHFASWRTLNSRFKEFFGTLSRRDILIIAFSSSLGEELFFRGLLQPSIGLVLTSLIFGLLHVGTEKIFWLWTAMALVLGFVLGGMMEYTGNILAPLIAHFTINYFNLLSLYSTENSDG